MSKYVLIESRDPFESLDVRFIAETAATLKQSGNDVTVFLVQNGVLAARKRARNSHIPMLTEAGVTILADDFSLQERGIQAGELNSQITRSDIDALVDMLIEGNAKAIWH